MKNFTQKINQNRYFLLFILLFAYAESIYIRIIVRQQIDAYTFTPEMALATLASSCILFLIILYFIRRWQKTDVLQTGTMWRIFSSSVLVFVGFMLLTGFLIALAFGNLERNFNPNTLMVSLFSDFLNGIIYGSFFLAYYYHQINKKQQQQLANYNQALAESKISQLKNQLNPHFLFNNLNVLDQLIEEDKDKASDFLNEFAEIYRYVLQSTDKEVVRIEDEIDFAQRYFKLIQHKYNTAYQLQIEHKNTTGFMVPMTLQLLLENAVQHNLGTAENPVYIQLKIDENITVSNTIKRKRNSKPTSGRALNNLKQQYDLLSKKPLQIHQTEANFSVEVPIISTHNT